MTQPHGWKSLAALMFLALAVLPGPLRGTCNLMPWALAIDVSLTGDSDANGILEPGESVLVRPSWKAIGGTCSPSTVTAKASLSGPSTGGYIIEDDAARYAIPTSGVVSCGPTSLDCYVMSVSANSARPALHWDATFTEKFSYGSTVCGGAPQQCAGPVTYAKNWTLHVGDSFTDVPRSQPFYQKIETLLHRGITSGCSPTQYCPGQNISRGQVATFVAKGLAGSAANISASGTVGGQPYDCIAGGASLFTDVLPTDMFCKQIHYIAARNVDLGCAPGLFCAGDTLTRLGMASIVANALVQPGGDAGVPLTYGPDSVTGLSYSCDPATPNLHFTDVPDSDPLCGHVNYLWARGIIAGCSAAEYCPAGEVTRDQVAKFLVNTFKLTLHGK